MLFHKTNITPDPFLTASDPRAAAGVGNRRPCVALGADADPRPCWAGGRPALDEEAADGRHFAARCRGLSDRDGARLA